MKELKKLQMSGHCQTDFNIDKKRTNRHWKVLGFYQKGTKSEHKKEEIIPAKFWSHLPIKLFIQNTVLLLRINILIRLATSANVTGSFEPVQEIKKLVQAIVNFSVGSFSVERFYGCYEALY